MTKSFMLFLLLIATSFSYAESDRARALLIESFHAPAGLIKFNEGIGSPILLIHGINPSEEAVEWTLPVEKLLQLNKNLYYFRWSKYKSVTKNTELLIESLKILSSHYPEQEITVLGHSTGGAIGLMAMSKLNGNPLQKHIRLHTMATPMFGYGVPKIAHMISPFIGTTTIDMGVGVIDRMKNQVLQQCSHWVNTNCELDSHACKKHKISPQGDEEQDFPCGRENTHFIDDENHHSIISRVLNELELQ